MIPAGLWPQVAIKRLRAQHIALPRRHLPNIISHLTPLARPSAGLFHACIIGRTMHFE
jgi:hypothetical protein